MIGKLLIGSVSAFYTYLIIVNSQSLNVSDPTLPTILCGALGFVIGSVFISIYGISIDSILYCLCIKDDY